MIASGLAALLLVVLACLGWAYYIVSQQLRQERAEKIDVRQAITAAQRTLADTKTRRKLLVSVSTQALIIVEADYTISSANNVAQRMFGSLVNKTTTLMAWTRQHHLQELVNQVLASEKMPPLYFYMRERYLEAHARSIKEEGRIVAVALAIHDVTELKHLSRAKRDFIANISHELRTPLASIQLLTETLLNGVLDDPRSTMAHGLVNKIGVQAKTLRQLAQELMDLSLIESGQSPLKLTPHVLCQVATMQTEKLLPQAERKHNTLQVNIPPNLSVLIDDKMVGRVITNLVQNAIKFTEHGTITVGVDGLQISDNGGKSWVTVCVADTGVGIDPDHLPRIFERFYKIDQARTPNQGGTGLGLSIARHIIEGHGGRIWAHSDGRMGTTFYFTLPLHNAPPIET